MDVYVQVIAKEARARGITVEVLDPPTGLLRMVHRGREILAFDSLTELTSAVAMTRCADKQLTRRTLRDAGLTVPRGQVATSEAADEDFLDEVGELAVKPAHGEQATAVTVGVRDRDELCAAVTQARGQGDQVLLEERVRGLDLRVIVIDHVVAAAAVRRRPEVTGTGRHSIVELIEEHSRARQQATAGESSVALDEDTRDAVAAAGYTLDDVPGQGETVVVRGTANLHTGGSMHDVTDRLHPAITTACQHASRVLRIPVVGLDLIVGSVEDPDHVFLEANERPGLAFHDPAPAVARFVDLLFPETAAA